MLCSRHPGDNPFYSNIDSMPDIRPRRKSIPLVSELVSKTFNIKFKFVLFPRHDLLLYWEHKIPKIGYPSSTYVQRFFVKYNNIINIRTYNSTEKRVCPVIFFGSKYFCTKFSLLSVYRILL